MRLNRQEAIVVDEFTLNEEFQTETNYDGVLSFTNEFDDSNQIYLSIGKKLIGFIEKEQLVHLAKKIIEMWSKPKEKVKS